MTSFASLNSIIQNYLDCEVAKTFVKTFSQGLVWISVLFDFERLQKNSALKGCVLYNGKKSKETSVILWLYDFFCQFEQYIQKII